MAVKKYCAGQQQVFRRGFFVVLSAMFFIVIRLLLACLPASETYTEIAS
ncbi:hypothetical protein CAter282_3744 [Collimonas arenae]|uniref:Uncharacterized protein n=1 Tax=Collimonas arenae TaxID=279058 RepID=A0A127QP93_9BURK|nr:hypothetical protein CAter10_4091 [Collimonas arenae]AMP11422.1 hypothetical protein CAter282_3744 [Collimonas arenae]